LLTHDRVKFLYFNLGLLFVFSCASVNSKIIENESQIKFEGFSNDNTFQVHCSISIFKYSEKNTRRNELLDICKKRIVTQVAEFKIAYDYNIKNLKFKTQEKYKGVLNKRTEKENYRIENQSAKILNLNQLSIDWNDDKISKLLNHYKAYFPGRILYEWTEADQEYFVYSIHYPSLMNEIKNSLLPFGVIFD